MSDKAFTSTDEFKRLFIAQSETGKLPFLKKQDLTLMRLIGNVFTEQVLGGE